MTPKEKAKELINKFYDTNTHGNSVKVRWELAKQFAYGTNLPNKRLIVGVDYSGYEDNEHIPLEQIFELLNKLKFLM
jgi:hypothetical protein